MPSFLEPSNVWLMSGVFGLLSVASVVGWLLGRRAPGRSDAYRRMVANLNSRLRAWWVIVIVCTASLLLGRVGAAVLFAGVSFLALREIVALVPLRAVDRPLLFTVYLVVIPLQYWLAASGAWEPFGILVPVGAFVLIPVWMAVSGESEGFLERAALLQWGLLACVYGVSHAPALLALPLPNQGPRLLAFFLLVAQLSDVFQYVWGKGLGRHPLAPRISPHKTWEGFVGGVTTATAVGASLHWVTPFTPWQAAGMSVVITLLGFAGGLVMSAIKRDRGVKDFGTLLGGHGGVLDRIDSLCFAAPVFFYLTRAFFT